MTRSGNRSQRVEPVVHTDQREGREHALRRATKRNRAIVPDRPHSLPQRGRVGVGVGAARRDVEIFDLAPAAAREHALQIPVTAVDDQTATLRHRAHEVMELSFDRSQVGKDVRVIVVEIVEDRRARPIMDELRALVGERRVVFVGLDHEEGATRKARRDAEIHRHAADQEARIEPGVVEYPGEQRRGRGLAVRARDREHPFVAQDVLGEPLRSGSVGAAAVEDRLEQRIAS